MIKLGWSKSSWVELSQDEFEQAEPSWAKLSRAEPSWAQLSWAKPSWAELSRAETSWANINWAKNITLQSIFNFLLFCILPINPFNSLLPWPNIFLTFQLSSAWLSLAQLGSAWHSLAQLGSALLCFCFTLFFSGILSPNLASFSPKPFGHVYISNNNFLEI